MSGRNVGLVRFGDAVFQAAQKLVDPGVLKGRERPGVDRGRAARHRRGARAAMAGRTDCHGSDSAERPR
ncbi:MAG: hypothetical protein M0Z40_11640, partial [Actinomycetota bacterium]|nr:hypothetical protein [Actinomycetota bacterium]